MAPRVSGARRAPPRSTCGLAGLGPAGPAGAQAPGVPGPSRPPAQVPLLSLLCALPPGRRLGRLRRHLLLQHRPQRPSFRGGDGPRAFPSERGAGAQPGCRQRPSGGADTGGKTDPLASPCAASLAPGSRPLGAAPRGWRGSCSPCHPVAGGSLADPGIGEMAPREGEQVPTPGLCPGPSVVSLVALGFQARARGWGAFPGAVTRAPRPPGEGPCSSAVGVEGAPCHSPAPGTEIQAHTHPCTSPPSPLAPRTLLLTPWQPWWR